MNKTAVIFANFGPYHLARLQAAADLFGERGEELVGIEVARTDSVYGWEPAVAEAAFRHVTLFPDTDHAVVSGRAVAWATRRALASERPTAVALPGWSDSAARAGLSWCRDSNARAVLMSESSEGDFRRRWWREWIKRRIVSRFDAALVGGERHAAYARKLGVPLERIHCGYDVVDNRYFSDGADRARAAADRIRRDRGLPRRYFLAISRFVPKKNLAFLVSAFATYRRAAPADCAWDLVLVGDGPERPAIEDRIQRCGLSRNVHLPGFLQYPVLPEYYGLAGAFVHVSLVEQWGLVVNEAMASGLPVIVSERCGCAPELVRDAVNGYCVSATQGDELVRLLLELSSEERDRDAMGRASRNLIEDWSPKAFADGLWQACHGSLPAQPGAA